MTLLVDTSGLFAAADASATEHELCVRVLEAAGPPLLLSPFVLAELDYLLTTRLGQDAALTLLQDVADGAFQLEVMADADIAAARAVMSRYRELSVGLADASICVLAARHGAREVLTLHQRHFRVLPTPDGVPFRILPADHEVVG